MDEFSEVNEDWKFCSTEGCPGDARYAAPGRGHVEGCVYPRGSAFDIVLKNTFLER